MKSQLEVFRTVVVLGICFLLTIPLYGKKEKGIDSEVLNFVLHYNFDLGKGNYYFKSVHSNVVIDSGYIDNSHCTYRHKLEKIIADIPLTLTPDQKFVMFRAQWFIGERVQRSYDGRTSTYYPYEIDTVWYGQNDFTFNSHLHGEIRIFKDGVLCNAYSMHRGARIGKLITYFDNGNVMSVDNYILSGKYDRTVLDGASTYFSKRGRIRIIEVYDKGTPIKRITYNWLGRPRISDY